MLNPLTVRGVTHKRFLLMFPPSVVCKIGNTINTRAAKLIGNVTTVLLVATALFPHCKSKPP